MKRALLLLLSVSLLFSVFATSAAAAVKDGKTSVKTLVAIGDSIASGYMLPDYNPKIDRPRTSTAAPVTLAKEIGYDFVDMTKEGTTTESVLKNQFSEEYEEYVIDPETMWFIKGPDGKRLSYTFDNRANLARLKTADIVTVSVGNYDLVSFFSLENKIMGELNPEEGIEPSDIIALLGDVWNEIDTKTTESAENLRGVFEKIREFNPDATIAFQNLYNTYQQVNVIEVQMFVRLITQVLNAKTKRVCRDMDIMYVDVYEKFDDHKDENLINMDCPTREDYENKNYQNDSHPTLLGHRYIMETYLEAFEEAGILTEYNGAELDESYSVTRNEAHEGLDKALPKQIVLNTTDGDYSVSVKNWKTDGKIDFDSSSEQTLKATAILDEDTVPDFIRNIKEISTNVKITGTYTPPATTVPTTTKPIEDPDPDDDRTESPVTDGADEDTDSVDTDTVTDTDTDGTVITDEQMQGPSEDTSDNGVGSESGKDTNNKPDKNENNNDEDDYRAEYRSGDKKALGIAIICAVVGVGAIAAGVAVYYSRKRF